MATLPQIGLAIYLGGLVCWLFRILFFALTKRNRQRDISQKYQCEPIQKKYPHRGPFLGTDLFIRNALAASRHQFLESVTKRHDEISETYHLNMLGTVGIMTRDHEIIKAVLSIHFKDYNLGAERKRALNAILGNGIFSSDGASWAHSRALFRPRFVRAQLLDLSMLETHVGRLIDRIPNEQEIDLQELLFRFTMDTATDFLLGESTDDLLADQEDRSALQGFVESIQYAQDRTALHLALGRWALLMPDPKFRHHVDVVHKFIDKLIRKALQEQNLESPDTKPHPYIFLRALVEDVKDPVQIRDEVINILIAGRDTTASLISNVFLMLSRKPQIWARLKNEVLAFQGRAPKFEELSRCKYVRYTINESLRLFPPVPINSHVANYDTVIPRGGGPDGKAPVLVPQGMPIIYNVFGLHRREDIYGADTEEFRPERWESLRLGWEFLPFSGGPRICIGRTFHPLLKAALLQTGKMEPLTKYLVLEQFAITEASYVLIRFLQTFEIIESSDPRPWQEKIALTVSSLHGVKVLFKQA